MRFYLSSYKIGNEIEELKKIIPNNKKTAYVSNALDFSDDQNRLKEHTDFDINDLKNVGLDVERFDLRNYFYKNHELEKDLSKYGVIWVSGGNVFVLRQAMFLSGFDKVLKNLKNKSNLLYGGYSAGVCILGPSLKGLELVDSVNYKPYKEQVDIIWDGLNLIDYLIIPHFQSNHPESKAINNVVKYCDKYSVSYKTLKDGEVIII
jgi:dipeptidase E